MRFFSFQWVRKKHLKSDRSHQKPPRPGKETECGGLLLPNVAEGECGPRGRKVVDGDAHASTRSQAGKLHNKRHCQRVILIYAADYELFVLHFGLTSCSGSAALATVRVFS